MRFPFRPRNKQNSPPQQHQNNDGGHSTSWQPVSSWYNKTVGESGQYYHQHTVLPTTLRLLSLKPDSSLLDVACGQGVLERQVPGAVYYQGIDISASLVKYAKDHLKSPDHHVAVGDATKPLPIQKRDFTHAAIILALQNMKQPELAIQQVAQHLSANGTLVLMLNHPMFRIPRQTSWGIDERNKMQYRRVDRYLSPLEIPISAAPSKGQHSAVTWSYHQPLSFYSKALEEAGFVIESIEELTSDKTSEGKAAKMENRSREEFPLFMAIKARKLH